MDKRASLSPVSVNVALALMALTELMAASVVLTVRKPVYLPPSEFLSLVWCWS